MLGTYFLTVKDTKTLLPVPYAYVDVIDLFSGVTYEHVCDSMGYVELTYPPQKTSTGGAGYYLVPHSEGYLVLRLGGVWAVTFETTGTYTIWLAPIADPVPPPENGDPQPPSPTPNNTLIVAVAGLLTVGLLVYLLR